MADSEYWIMRTPMSWMELEVECRSRLWNQSNNKTLK